MAQPRSFALAAAVLLAAGLSATVPAAAQSWQSEPLPGAGARAFVQSGGATLSVECTPTGSWPAIRVIYRPSSPAGIRLQPTAFSGQGEVGDGVNTGYLFFNFGAAGVQQFVRRAPQQSGLVVDAVGSVLLGRLRSDSRVAVAPSPAPQPVYDTFSLTGSSRTISWALDTCTAPPPEPNATVEAPPQPPDPAAPPQTGSESPATAGPEILGSAGDFVAMAEGLRCARVLTITIMAPDAAAFETGHDTLQALIADVQAAATADCPDAQILRISGLVGDTQVYDGVAARATLWSLTDLVLPGEAGPAGLPMELPPADVAPVESPPTQSTPPDIAATVPEEPASPPPTAEDGPPQSSLFGRPPEPATPAADAPATIATPEGPLGAGITCPPAPDPADYATPADDGQADDRTYGRSDDRILVRQEPGVFAHYAGAGDDTVYVFGGNAGTHVSLDVGSDVLVFCALNEVSYSVAGGNELSSFDSDTDLVIFEPGAFRDIPAGFQRSFFIYSIVPANDRIILRLPADLDAQLVDFESGFPKILVGDAIIQLAPTTLEAAEPIDPAMVIIERVPG